MYTALWFSAAALSVTVVALFVVGLWPDADPETDLNDLYQWITLATLALTLILATIGWIWSARAQIQMQRSTNALQLLARTHEKSVFDLKQVVYNYIQEHNTYLRAARENPKSLEAQAAPSVPRAEVEKLLGVYEQLAVAVVTGSASEAVVKEAQCLIFKRIYTGLKLHIDYCQQDNPTYFIHFEQLTFRWFPDLAGKPAMPQSFGILFDPLKNSYGDAE